MSQYDTVLCDKLLALLSDYFEGVTRPACRDIEKHIGNCAPCRAFVESLRQVIAKPRSHRPEKPSARVVAHLRQAILVTPPAKRPARALQPTIEKREQRSFPPILASQPVEKI